MASLNHQSVRSSVFQKDMYVENMEYVLWSIYKINLVVNHAEVLMNKIKENNMVQLVNII